MQVATISAQRVRVEREERFSPTAIRRIMDHAAELGVDVRASTQLGLLHMQGFLTEREMAAGLAYAEVVGRYDRAKGIPRRSAKSPSYDDGFGDSSVDMDALKRMDPATFERLEERTIRRVRRAEKAYEACIICIPDRPLIAREIINTLCLADRPVPSIHLEGIKAVLSAMGSNCFGFRPEQDNAPKKRRRRGADAKMLADALVETLAESFERKKLEVTHFEIDPASTDHTRGLAVTGVRGDVVVRRVLSVHRNKLPPPLVDAELLRAAAAKWRKE